MLLMDASLTIFRVFTQDLIGLPVSHIWRGHGSAIFIEFGELTPSKLIRRDGSTGNAKGQFSLMIDADWRLERGNNILCGSTSDDQVIDAQLPLLRGSVAEKADVVDRLPELLLKLKTGTYISTFKSDEISSEWALADRRSGPPTRWLTVKDGELQIEAGFGVRADSTGE